MPKPPIPPVNELNSKPHHRPALAETAAKFLLDTGGNTFIDCTAGAYGGHIKALLKNTDKVLEILAIDIDPDAVNSLKTQLKEYPEVIITIGDYINLETIAKKFNFKDIDGIIADYGPSLDQILYKPGFSHSVDAPLDMRYSPERSFTASDLLNSSSQTELTHIFSEIAEDRYAHKIAEAVIAKRPIYTTTQLTQIIKSVVKGPHFYKSLARIYMALRVMVNDELNSIKLMLPQALNLLRIGGRLVCITWDSNQDRLVKSFFKQMENPCICSPDLPCICGAKPKIKILTRRPIKPTVKEIIEVPHSKSARMRVAEKII